MRLDESTRSMVRSRATATGMGIARGRLKTAEGRDGIFGGRSWSLVPSAASTISAATPRVAIGNSGLLAHRKTARRPVYNERFKVSRHGWLMSLMTVPMPGENGGPLAV
jgi:hypothetical protein